MTDYAPFDAYVTDHLAAWTDELVEFCRFPSESTDRAALRGAADWIAERLRRLGADVDMVELPGEPGVPPLVVGEIGAGAKTLNAVQHYDVQPAMPLDLWTAPPYEPEVRDGRLYARGATDNKGELMARVWAIEAYLATVGPLPCRVRFLVEGEEEYGSHHLDSLLDQRAGIRQVDGALIEGGGVDLLGRPQVAGGVRGIIVVELVCRTLAYDAHSSLATIFPSAPVRLVQALATLWNRDGTPAMPGLQAGLTPPTAAQLAIVDATPTEDLESLAREFEVKGFIGGVEGVEAARAYTLRPTCNIQGLWSGYFGPGAKTITPAEARVRLDIRLVPDQDPATVLAALRTHLDREGFEDIEMLAEAEQERAYWTTPDDPLIQAAMRVSEAVFDKPASRYLSAAGTAPMWQVCGRDQIRMTSLGAAADDCRAHAPDENYPLDLLAKAVTVTARFLDAFAAID